MAATNRESFLAHNARIEGNSKSQIKHLIEESQSKITSLASQIASLTAKCEQERVYLAALQYSIAPVRTLPVELLGEIFGWAGDPLHWRVYNDFKSSLRVSQVCLHWRQVAQTTPRLWTGPLSISNRIPAKMSIPDYAEGLRAWIARSAPLHIPVSFETDYESPGTWEDISPILEEVLKVSSRWCSFKICDSGPLNAPFIKRLEQYPMDSLEYIFEEVDNSSGPPVVVYFGSTPRLRRVHLYRGILSASWSEISELILCPYGEYGDSALEIVLQCPNLVDLTVEAELLDKLHVASTVVTFNHLRTMSLVFTGDRHFTPFLNPISAPRLEKLFLELDMGMPWDEAEFTAFQRRSPNLTRLELRFAELLTASQLRSVLIHAPSLTQLRLYECLRCLDDNIIQDLHYRDGVIPLAPNLQHLELELHGPPERRASLEDNVADMICSRWWTNEQLALLPSTPSVPRWASLRLQAGRNKEFGHRLMDAIQELQSQGLQVLY